MRNSTRMGIMFNLIDTEEGVKADLVPLTRELERFRCSSVINVTRNADGCTIRFNMGLPPGLEPGLAFPQAYQRWPHLSSRPKFASVQIHV
jgi:hypothetical protein